jgi:ubiquinone/menaquinone biosynthesis C-methylase UbiE
MENQQSSFDYAEITVRQQATWSLGDFNELARQVMAVSDALVEAVDPRPGQRVLDVACGSGNAAISAARRYCKVTGLDYVPSLVERAKQRAAAEGVPIDFRVGDAQSLPFGDASFDVVVSTFGVMFAPDQAKAASEVLRVCKPGGKIGLANWGPEDFGGTVFRAIAKHAPPPPGLTPSIRWGTPAGIEELLGPGTSNISATHRTFFQHFESIDHMADVFFRYFGPANRAMSVVDAATQPALRRDVADTFAAHNRATDGTARIESRYYQVIATRR